MPAQDPAVAQPKNFSQIDLIMVGLKSNPRSVAGLITNTIRQRGSTKIRTIGAGALNQAIKSIAIARGFLAPSGIDLVFEPSFRDIEIDGVEKTAIVFLLFNAQK